MRIPADFNRYKSNGRRIDIDLDDPVINQLGEREGKAAKIRFADWLRSNGWNVSTQHSGPMRVGDRTSEQDKFVASLELLLLDEFSHPAVAY